MPPGRPASTDSWQELVDRIAELAALTFAEAVKPARLTAVESITSFVFADHNRTVFAKSSLLGRSQASIWELLRQETSVDSLMQRHGDWALNGAWWNREVAPLLTLRWLAPTVAPAEFMVHRGWLVTRRAQGSDVLSFKHPQEPWPWQRLIHAGMTIWSHRAGSGPAGICPSVEELRRRVVDPNSLQQDLSWIDDGQNLHLAGEELLQLAERCAADREARWIHGDLKPEHVFISPQEQVTMIDPRTSPGVPEADIAKLIGRDAIAGSDAAMHVAEIDRALTSVGGGFRLDWQLTSILVLIDALNCLIGNARYSRRFVDSAKSWSRERLSALYIKLGRALRAPRDLEFVLAELRLGEEVLAR